MWWRLAPLAAAWALAGGGYGGLWLARLPREGTASKWLDWSSTRLAELAKSRGWWIATSWPWPTDRVVEVDLATGKTRRIVATRRSMTYTRISVSPDGRSLFLASNKGLGVDRVSTRSGRTLGTCPVPPGRGLGEPGSDAVIGYSTDGRTAYVQWLDDGAAISGVTAWNLDTGSAQVVVRTPAYVDTRSGRNWAVGRQFLPLPGPTPRFVSWPTFMESYNTKECILRLHDACADGHRELTPDPMPDYSFRPVVTPDAKTLYYASTYGRWLVGLDLERSESIGRVSMGMGGVSDLALSANGRFVAAPAHGAVLIRDTVSRRWLAQLRHPADVYGARPWISPDGRWVAALCQKNVGANGGTTPPGSRASRFTHEVTVWDLKAALDTLARGPVPPGVPDQGGAK
jgi:hypothetical protein